MKDLFGIGFDVQFSEFYKIMVNKIPFVGCWGKNAPSWICPWTTISQSKQIQKFTFSEQNRTETPLERNKLYYSYLWRVSFTAGGIKMKP